MDTVKTKQADIFTLLATKNVPSVLEKIFLNLDFKSYKTCLEVSRAWNVMLKSEQYRKKGKSVFSIEILKDEYSLRIASLKGEKERARNILSTGMVDINSVNLYGSTPLHLAAIKGKADVVEYLIKYGADKTTTTIDGKTPLFKAAESGHKDTVKLLIGAETENTMILATKGGNISVVRMLLDAGADPNMKSSRGDTPLLMSANEGNLGITKLLLQRGAQPNIVGRSGYTPLHQAACNGNIDVVKELLEKGADPNMTSLFGSTPLHFTVLQCTQGKKEMVKLLMDFGADVNIADGVGKTPKCYAAEKGFHDIVNMLIGQEVIPERNMCLLQ